MRPSATHPTPSQHAGAQDAAMDGAQRLLEYASCRGLSLRVDTSQGVISGVKILGLVSANGREYSPDAIAAARSLYEGRPVNVDHHDGGRRSYRDRIGKIVRVEARQDGLYGDLVVNPKHPLAEQLLWDAQHAPENVGLSHDAQGRTVARGGKTIVEAIHAVRSVDLVAEPATTKGLFEDKEATMKQNDLSQLTLAELKEARPDLVAEIQAAADVEKQLAALKEEHDRVKRELGRFQRREALREAIAAAKLDWDNIPASLREMLVEVADERRQQILTDLKAMLPSKAATPHAVRPGAAGVPATFDERLKSWTL